MCDVGGRVGQGTFHHILGPRYVGLGHCAMSHPLQFVRGFYSASHMNLTATLMSGQEIDPDPHGTDGE